MLNILEVRIELRQVWLTAAKQSNKSGLIVLRNELELQLKEFLRPIVENRYSELLNNGKKFIKIIKVLVVEILMNLLCVESNWNPAKVSVFQFVALFRGKNLNSFIENLSHEAWIITNLLSDNASVIIDVMSRLSKVPLVPPLESLRHIGIVLIKNKNSSTILMVIGKSIFK